MKKICLILMMLLLFLGVIPFNSNATDAQNESCDIFVQLNEINDDGIELINDSVFYDETVDDDFDKGIYIHPNYEDTSYEFSTPHASHSLIDSSLISPMATWTVKRDSYENNNSFSSANDMTLGNPNNVYSGSRTFHTTFHKEPWYLGGGIRSRLLSN